MSKRVRITAIVTTLCLCLSLFVIGVLSATTATLNVTSTLRFEADGVYVMVDASLKQGASVTDADVIEGEGEPTGQATYTAYSYKKATDSNAPDGSASSDTFLQADGTTPAGDWAIGDIYFTSQNIVVVYEFMVYNYSPFEVMATVEGVSEALASYTDKLSVTTYTGTTSADATATGTTYTFNIPARTSTTEPGQACYKIAITLNNFMSNISTNEIAMNFNFEEYNSNVNYEYFTIENNEITGLTEAYYSDTPETLKIPGHPKDNPDQNLTLNLLLYDVLDPLTKNVELQDGLIPSDLCMYEGAFSGLNLDSLVISYTFYSNEIFPNEMNSSFFSESTINKLIYATYESYKDSTVPSYGISNQIGFDFIYFESYLSLIKSFDFTWYKGSLNRFVAAINLEKIYIGQSLCENREEYGDGLYFSNILYKNDVGTNLAEEQVALGYEPVKIYYSPELVEDTTYIEGLLADNGYYRSNTVIEMVDGYGPLTYYEYSFSY